MEFIALCPKGLELLLVEELARLGAESPKEKLGAVHFTGELPLIYKVLINTRLANRILLPLHEGRVSTDDELYELAQSIDWEMHFGVNDSFKVDFRGTHGQIRHEQYGARRVKDAIADLFNEEQGKRPSVDLDSPDILINVQLHKGVCRIALDLSGSSLHRRGYRTTAGLAPIKENLAAALLLRGGLLELLESGEPVQVIDPMCGSGTILIEALMFIADYAPGLFNSDYAINRWRGHQPEQLEMALSEAKAKSEEGLRRLNETGQQLIGFEADGRTFERALQNIKLAGFDGLIKVTRTDFKKAEKPEALSSGLIITNPPYGERMGDVHSLAPVYAALGEFMRSFPGYKGAIITSEGLLAKQTSIHAHKSYALQNGPIACRLYCFELLEENFKAGGERLSEEAEALKNRLSKNFDKYSKWAAQLPTEVYRIYESDLPQYAFAIDVYRDHLHIQEYAAPKSISSEQSRLHQFELMRVIGEVLPFKKDNRHLKVRQKQKGSEQYNRQSKRGQRFEVTEQGLKFWVNLTDYLDTGLFADHRKVRSLIKKNSAGKRFLNLFAYTCTASVYAAAGGALSTTSVDMSNTYLKWGEDNMKLNRLLSPKHEFIKADCMQWLKSHKKQYDIIFVDPPSFSNSKSMEQHFDIQAHHSELIEGVMARLAPEGVAYFSTNRRAFKLDEELLEKYLIRPMGKRSISTDFVRQRLPHQAFEIRHLK